MVPTSKIVLVLADRTRAHAVSGAMQDLLEPAPDALTLFEDGPRWRIEAYYAEPPDEDDLKSALAGLLGEDAISDAEIGRDVVPDLNWVALSQAALPPVRAGRFVVHGSHDRGRVAQGPGAILVEAGEAFGTAHHATTFGCLLALDRLTRRRHFSAILDLGTGSGVLAIALARALPCARIVATDLDETSVDVARQNVRVNRVAARVQLLTATGLSHARLRRRFDLAVANILADPLIELARDVARAMVPGGVLVLSGILVPQAPRVIAAYRSAGFRLLRHARIDEWSTLELQRS